jgi:hypothetical protein
MRRISSAQLRGLWAGAVSVYRPLRGTGHCQALCCGKSSFLGSILALLPLEEAIAVSGVGWSRLYQLFDEPRENQITELAGEQALAKATT